MADTAISGLTAASAAALTDQFAVNQGGTTKMETLQQIIDAVIKRVAGSTMAAGEYISSLVLSANSSSITGTGFITVMEITGVGTGRYKFRCELVYQTTATTTGINVTATHTGTVTGWIMRASVPTTGGAAATKAAVSAAQASQGGMWETEVERTKGNAIGTLSNFTVSVDAANTDQIVVIEGTFKVTASGDFRIQLSAELAALVCTARENSSLELWKLST